MGGRVIAPHFPHFSPLGCPTTHVLSIPVRKLSMCMFWVEVAMLHAQNVCLVHNVLRPHQRTTVQADVRVFTQLVGPVASPTHCHAPQALVFCAICVPACNIRYIPACSMLSATCCNIAVWIDAK